MKKLNDQLKKIAKSLSALSSQVEKISKEADKLQSSQRAGAKKKAVKKAPAKKKAAKKSAKKIIAPKATAARQGKATVLDSVMAAIKRNRNGASIGTLRAKTGLGARQLSNALYKLTKRGVIVTKSRGVYVAK